MRVRYGLLLEVGTTVFHFFTDHRWRQNCG